jgi:AcrR family transcriptional regulator
MSPDPDDLRNDSTIDYFLLTSYITDSKVRGDVFMDPKLAREQTIRDTKSNLILDAARQIFSEKGFHETRLEDIAGAAGFSKASLYNYYEDKETIFFALSKREFHELLETLSSVARSGLPVMRILEDVSRSLLQHFGKHFAFFLAATHFHGIPGFNSEQHKALYREYANGIKGLMGMITEIFKNGRVKGEISSGIDDATLAGYYGSLIRGVMFQWKSANKMGNVEAEVRNLMEFITNGAGIRK